MFSQNKQAPPTIKMVIKSKLSTEKDQIEVNNTNISTTEIKPTAKNSKMEPNLQRPIVEESSTASTITNNTSIESDLDKKRKRSDKDNFSLASKKVHLHLERWNQKHEELVSKDKEKKEENSLETTSDNTMEDFADYTLMACLLCQRKFKTPNDISRHQALSELHKKNSKNPVAIEKARAKKQQLNQSSNVEINQEQENTTLPTSYRNRAAERRHAYNQPETPTPIKHSHTSESAKRQQQKQQTHEHVSISNPMSDNNLGAKLMKQMGWKKGEGLGKEGSGIVNPIMAERYSPGAGLGTAHAKSRIDSKSSGSDSYKERAKELARRRLYDEL
ncbi:unnamed protein product [Cunninghamella blakesleeana]